MKSRAKILFALATTALLPLLPVPAAPAGEIQKGPLNKSAAMASTAELKNVVDTLGKTRGEMTQALKKQQALNTSARSHIANALKLTQEQGGASGQKLESIRKSLESAMKELEAHDKLGNFEIQQLMSKYNQAEALASNVQKKQDDTLKSQIQKIN